MSDDQKWQSPGGAPRGADEPAPPAPPVPTPPADYSPPPFGAETAAPPNYAPQGAGMGQPGWVPPPKPGLIPLRPLELGTILGASFRVLRRNPRPTFGAALLIQGVIYLLVIGVVGAVTFSALARIASSTAQDTQSITYGAYGLIAISAIIPGLLAVVASAVLQGIIVLEVSRGTVGERLKFRELWRRARGRLGALIGWTAILLLAVTVVIGLLVGLIVVVVATLGTVGIVIGVLIGIFGGLAYLALYAWLGTKFSLVPSALMIERLTLRRAVARSWSLTTGSFWRTFGIELLVAVILGVATQVISTPLSFISPLITQLVDPNAQNGITVVIVAIGFTLLSFIVIIVFQAITAVVQAAATALIYIDLRIRKEGLDLELARFVEARQGGDASVVDPFLSRESGFTGQVDATVASPPSGPSWA